MASTGFDTHGGDDPHGEELPELEAAAFVALVLTLAGPQIVVDRDFWFTRRYLLLPDPCFDWPLDAATLARVLSGREQAETLVNRRRIGTRGAWAWNFLGNYLYFAGSAQGRGPDDPDYPRFDCPARVPGVLEPVAPFLVGADLGPPYPDESSESQAQHVLATAARLARLNRLGDYLAAIGRRPGSLFEFIEGGDRGLSDPADRGYRRLLVNPWGDLATSVRPAVSEGGGDPGFEPA